MDLSIIIVSWNVREKLLTCLNSIFKNLNGLDFEVFVVDNGSSDGSALAVKKNFPQVKLTENSKNLGFARANNLALGRSTGEYILILNPDTEIYADTVQKSLSCIKTDPQIGALGCKITNADGSVQPSVRRFPTFCSQLLILYKLHHFFPRLGPLRRYFAADFDYETGAEVDQIMGAFMLLPRKIFTQVGMFDENFYIWFEEVDLCKRIKAAGFKIYYFPEATIKHYGGQSFKQLMPLKKRNFFNESLLLYFRKHHNLLAWLCLAAAQYGSLFLVWLYQFKKVKASDPK
ncbi:glycosyltransferase family 2 protein [Candidatus Parcubacteria bacterium]|nr:MAG: glycosyltransferase family 2 protein [Candidatus Parcubacteria bacterium]